jgi:hypothetical protein
MIKNRQRQQIDQIKKWSRQHREKKPFPKNKKTM